MEAPSTANYLITATVAAPILVKMGIPVMCAHLCIFYFGIMPDVTPPVALAAYAGSAIAKSNPLKTGVEACKLAIGAFLVPYMFVLYPVLIMQGGTPLGVIQSLIIALLGMAAISSCTTGCFNVNLRGYERLIMAVIGLMMLYPETVTDIIGLIIIVLMYLALKKRAEAEAAS